jgi:hypothetical protein
MSLRQLWWSLFGHGHTQLCQARLSVPAVFCLLFHIISVHVFTMSARYSEYTGEGNTRFGKELEKTVYELEVMEHVRFA